VLGGAFEARAVAVADTHLRAAQKGGRDRVDRPVGHDVAAAREFSASLQTEMLSSADAIAGSETAVAATSQGMTMRMRESRR
jgi:hypothetical protein